MSGKSKNKKSGSTPRERKDRRSSRKSRSQKSVTHNLGLSPEIAKRLSISRIPTSNLSPRDQNALAMIDPFDPRVVGVMGPSEWGMTGTCARCIRLVGSLTSNASGVVNLAFFPSLTMTGACLATTYTNSFAWGGTAPEYSVNGTTEGAWGLQTTSSAGTQFFSERVLYMGVKVRNNLSFNTVAGRWSSNAYPCTEDSLCSQSNFNQIVPLSPGSDLVKDQFGWSSVVGSNTTIDSSTITVGADQLINQELMFRSSPCGPGAFHWKNCLNDEISDNGYDLASNVAIGVVGAYAADRNTTHHCTDMAGLHLYASGLPVNTSVAHVSIILHFQAKENNVASGVISRSTGPRSDVTEEFIEKISTGLDLLSLVAPEASRYTRDIGMMGRAAGSIAGAFL